MNTIEPVTFEHLLVNGKLSDALQLRSDQIEELARSYRSDCEAAKLATAATAFVGLVMSASPLIAITAGMAALGFGYCVWRDWQITGQFHPVPGYRRNVLERVAGLAGQVGDDDDDPLADILPWLPPVLAHEYELLQVSEAAIVQCLGQIEGDRRQHAYSYLLRQTRLRAVLKLPPILEVKEAIAAGESSSIAPAEQLPPAEEMHNRNHGSTQWDEDEPLDDEAIAAQTWDEDEDTSAQWMSDLLEYPAVLIYGAQGSGKTTLATWLINQRIKRGHDVEILDPHKKFGQWKGLKVFGDGMDYEAIDRRLMHFAKLVKSRYKQRSQQATFKPKPLTYLTEEFTKWDSKCKYSADYFESTLADIRKINLFAVYVAHNNTLKSLGGAKNHAKTRDNTLLEVELFAQVDPTTGKAAPTGMGRLKYPGGRTIDITIPNLSSNTNSTSKRNNSSGSVQTVQMAEPTEPREPNQAQTKLEPDRTKPEPEPEPSQNFDGVDAKNEVISPKERGLVIETLRNGERTINGILLKVWGVKQGGSIGYKIARSKLEQILKDAGENLS